MADAPVLGTGASGRGGSSPPSRTHGVPAYRVAASACRVAARPRLSRRGLPGVRSGVVVRILAVADETVESLRAGGVDLGRVDLILGCGDLPLDYLDCLASRWNAPLAFVPGNHDPDLRSLGRSRSALALQAGLSAVEPVVPDGATVDGRVTDVAGLRIAGLGGCRRYRPGPNQYTDRQQRARALALRGRAGARGLRDGRPVDVVITHAPPLDCGDGPDRPHRGFAALHPLVRALRPRLLLHGHIHTYGQQAPDRTLHGTRVCNVVGYRVFEIPSGQAQVRPGSDRERLAGAGRSRPA